MSKLMGSVHTGTRWRQLNLWYDDWQAAEQMAVAHLGPRLTGTEQARIITSWGFARKGASWRLRCLPAHSQDEQATVGLEPITRDPHTHRRPPRRAAPIHEPEIHPLGGANDLALAH